jgi:hypothetical protein
LIIVFACIIAIAVIAYILSVRPGDLPEPEPESPFAHLDERKAAIYENLRDLQFEYRLGKLSDQDYQNTKVDLQKELAAVLAEVDRLKARIGGNGFVSPSTAVAAEPARQKDVGIVCPSCGSKFDKALKFCGECGQPMKAAKV